MVPSSVQRDASPNSQAAAIEDASGEAFQGPMCLSSHLRSQDENSAYSKNHPSDDIHVCYQLPFQSFNPSISYASQQRSSNRQSGSGTPGLAAAFAAGTSSDTSSGASFLPPASGFNLRKTGSFCAEPEMSLSLKDYCTRKPASSRYKNNDEARWGLEVQRKYDNFLERERSYITEGLLDRFPSGSRLFVGNLPTERITKRDLFHVFHKYGKLAQASIKRAYGFIQFLNSSSCKKALDAEQGALVRGRKIYLEISNPRTGARSGLASAEPPRPTPGCYEPPVEYNRNNRSYRSCPLNRRKSIVPEDCYDRVYESRRQVPFSDFRDEPTQCRQDDHQPPTRSLSPRIFHGRDGYRSRGKTPEPYGRRGRRRSQSPYRRYRRYRSPIPGDHCPYESGKDLPVLRRAPRDIPEVQILVLENVDQNFVFHVESSFRNRGLRAVVLTLGPRIPLDSVVQRQVIEGVLAVVRLSRSNELRRKIPLQLFDRSYGPVNVNSIEYPELEPSLAANIAFHVQVVQRGVSPAFWSPVTPFMVPPLPPRNPVPQPPLSALPNPPNVATMIASLAGSTLQPPLSALQQRPVPVIQQQQFPHANLTHAAADLASILNATRPSVTATSPTLPLPSQPFPVQAPDVPAVPGLNPLSLLIKGFGEQHL